MKNKVITKFVIMNGLNELRDETFKTEKDALKKVKELILEHGAEKKVELWINKVFCSE